MILVDIGDAKMAAGKAAVAATGTGAAYALGPPAKMVLGFTLAEIAAITTIAFALLQIAHLLWKWRQGWLDRQEKRIQEAVQT